MSLKTVNDYALFLSLLGGYFPTDEKVKSDDDDVKYTGYLNRNGEWYIMNYDCSVDGDNDLLSWRFAKGDSDYATNWTARESLDYDLPSVIFK